MTATLALVAGFLWLIVANVTAMFPSKDHHWSNAYKLIAVGLPILIWIAVTSGAIWAGVFLVAAGSVLRWPLLYLWRWVKSRAG
jgi:hypothetical protein